MIRSYFEGYTTIKIKITAFWDVTPFFFLKKNIIAAEKAAASIQRVRSHLLYHKDWILFRVDFYRLSRFIFWYQYTFFFGRTHCILLQAVGVHRFSPTALNSHHKISFATDTVHRLVVVSVRFTTKCWIRLPDLTVRLNILNIAVHILFTNKQWLPWMSQNIIFCFYVQTRPLFNRPMRHSRILHIPKYYISSASRGTPPAIRLFLFMAQPWNQSCLSFWDSRRKILHSNKVFSECLWFSPINQQFTIAPFPAAISR